MNLNYLTFSLDNSLYAFPVDIIQEVLQYNEPVKIPCSSSYVKGIINSREKGIPVVDLRTKFKLSTIENYEKSLIIILEINKPTEENPNHILTFGAICDSVQEVLEIENSNISPAPKFGTDISAEYINGIIKKDENFIVILNENKIFSTE